jgi:hypothetical protein
VSVWPLYCAFEALAPLLPELPGDMGALAWMGQVVAQAVEVRGRCEYVGVRV